jgi:hypothetical protein
MQIGKCLLVYNEFKSTIPKYDVTPAEVQLLVLMHSDNAGEIAVKELEVLRDEVRSSPDEKLRLTSKYIARHEDKKRVTVESVWPGHNSRLPVSFDEVTDKEGKPIFTKEGSALSKPNDGETMTIAGKVFTKADVEKLLAANIKPIEEAIPESELVNA